MDNVNRKFRTDHRANLTAVTATVIILINKVVAVTVNLVRTYQGVLRAKINAEITPFAPLLKQTDPVLNGF